MSLPARFGNDLIKLGVEIGSCGFSLVRNAQLGDNKKVMDSATTAPQTARGIDQLLDSLRNATKSPAFIPGVVLLLAIGILFQSLFRILPNIYNSPDGYYSHGWLVPFISAFIVYKRWDKLKDIPVKPGYIAIIPLLAVLYVMRPAHVIEFQIALSLGLIFTLLFGTWFVAGFRWMLGLSPAILYLAFGLPLWTMAIDNYTNPLQIYSTKVAFKLLQFTGFEPMYEGNTIINLNNFTLDVGVPCSGLKLLLAVTAFTFLFVLIARLKWWGNAIMLALILPLCLLINGLRIGLIGMVGDIWGSDAGNKFHDYSGYITLIVCFLILFRIAKWLGWKD